MTNNMDGEEEEMDYEDDDMMSNTQGSIRSNRPKTFRKRKNFVNARSNPIRIQAMQSGMNR